MNHDSSGKEKLAALCYHSVIPVEYELLKESANAALRQRHQHDNAILLQGLLVVDEQPVMEHDDELSSLGQELQRIDHKLNLVLELLSQALRSWRSLPAPVPVSLTVDGVEWNSEQELPVDKPVLLRLYLSSVFPNPFIVTGRVQDCRGSGDEFAVSVRFDGLGRQAREALEKLVFRQHRRKVARARQEKVDRGHISS